jgi:glycosyltransferase involved in cell wall biosynthesis
MIFVHSNYHPDNFGGIERVASEIIKLSTMIDPEVICYYGDIKNTDTKVDCVRYIGRKILFKVFGAPFLSLGNILFLLKARNSRLIIFQEPSPSLWPAIFCLRYFFKIPTIVLVHANPVSWPLIMKTYSKIRSIVFSGAACISTSPNLLRKVYSSGFLLSKCIPLSISDGSSLQGDFFTLPSRFALYIGRLAEYKGLIFLLKAAQLAPDINFVIAGKGPLSETIVEKISNLPVNNILFINKFITESEKSFLIKRAEFLIFPSTSENEAFGLVQLEAMRESKAIINTWLDSGVNYVAPSEVCAVTVPRKNVEELLAAIRRLWLDKALSHNLGIQGRNRFLENFSQEKFKKSWLDLIRAMLR